MPLVGPYAERHGRGPEGSRYTGPCAQEAAPNSHSRHRPLRAVSAAVDNLSLHGSPGRHSCGGDSAHSSRRKGRTESAPITQEERRLQRELARRQLGLLPPEQRYMPASSRKGTDEAARRALVAHLQEVDQAMKRIKDLTRSSRPRTHVQRLKARQASSMPVSPMRREPLSARDAAPPPYAPQLAKQATPGRQQASFDLHANASSPSMLVPMAPHSRVGLPQPQQRSSSSLRPDQARSAYSAPASPSRAVRLTRRASVGLPTIKESHVSLSALLSAPARLSPDRPVSQRRTDPQPPRRGAATPATSDAERRRRSEACLNARLQAHPEAQPRATSGAARALWPAASAASSGHHESRDSEADAVAAHSAAAVADKPTPPRTVPAAAMWAQPAAPLAYDRMPQGPFACTVPGSVRRYSSPAASPSPWRPGQAAGLHSAGAAGVSAGSTPQRTTAAEPERTGVTTQQAAAEDGGGDDWEDASRWLEPAAPGAAAALRTALAALAAGTPPKAIRSRRRNASAPGSRHTSAPGSPTASSRRPNFTQPLPWTPAGKRGTDSRPWFEKITEPDGAPLSLSSRLPLPRRPLGLDTSLLPAGGAVDELQDEEEARAMPANLAGMLAAVCNDAVGPAAPDSAEATPRTQPLELQHDMPTQDGAVPPAAEALVAASPAECVDQHPSPAEAEAGQPVAAEGAAEQQALLPAVDAPDAASPARCVDQHQSPGKSEAVLHAAAEDSAEQQASLPAVETLVAASPAECVDQHQGQAEAEASLPAAAGVAAEQQASLPAVETLVAASPAECFDQQQSPAEAEAVLPAAADSSAEQQELVPVEAPDAARPECVDQHQAQAEAEAVMSAAADGDAEQQELLPVEAPDASDAYSAGSSPRDAGPAADAPHAGPSSQDANVEDPVAAAPKANSGPKRRRQWRRVVMRREVAHPTPPGPAPASPLQHSPPQHSPAQLTGTTRAPGSPEPHVASATKRLRISPPPPAADTVHAPPTPEPQPWTAVSVPPRMLQPAEALQPTAAPSSDGDIAAEVPQLCFADISTELQPDPAAPALEDAAAETPRSAAAAADQPCHGSSALVFDGNSTAEEPQLPPLVMPACIDDDDAAVSNFHEDDMHEEDLSSSSVEELASHSTVDTESGAEAAEFQAAAAATAARAAAAATPFRESPCRESPFREPARSTQRQQAVAAASPAAGQEAPSPGNSSLSSVFADVDGFSTFSSFTPFTPALAAAAAAAEERQHQGGKRLRFEDEPPHNGTVTSEIEPAGSSAAPAQGDAAETALPRGDTCGTHPIGAALLAVQPGMKCASAGEVAAVLSRGVVMHKAWIHDTGNPTTGSTRKICWSVVGGEVHIGYQRRLMRCSVSTTLYRIYMLDGNALAVDTAQGVLILRPPDAALHALVLLGMNAAFALASGCAAKSDAVADLPWCANIMQDDSVTH